MNTVQLTIGPEVAEYLLQFNTANYRKIKRSLVELLARQMTDGEWQHTHQGLAFTGPDYYNPGVLVDGQHRLTAIIKSGTTQKFQVSWGCVKDTESVVDITGTRSFRERERISSVLSGVVGVYSKLVILNGSVQRGLIRSDLETFLHKYREEYEMLVKATPKSTRRVTTSELRLAVILRMASDPERKDAILKDYVDLVNGEFHNPRMSQLYMRLVNVGSTRVRFTDFWIAWAAFGNGASKHFKVPKPNIQKELVQQF